MSSSRISASWEATEEEGVITRIISKIWNCVEIVAKIISSSTSAVWMSYSGIWASWEATKEEGVTTRRLSTIQNV